MRSFDLIAKEAVSPAPSWTNKEKARFHYFNPNGVLAKKREMNELISTAVDEGRAKTGAILAYGSLSCFNEDRLYELTTKKYVSRNELNAVLEMLKSDVEYAKKFLATI